MKDDVIPNVIPPSLYERLANFDELEITEIKTMKQTPSEQMKCSPSAMRAEALNRLIAVRGKIETREIKIVNIQLEVCVLKEAEQRIVANIVKIDKEASLER